MVVEQCQSPIEHGAYEYLMRRFLSLWSTNLLQIRGRPLNAQKRRVNHYEHINTPFFGKG
jgi:hypothetical protein